MPRVRRMRKPTRAAIADTTRRTAKQARSFRFHVCTPWNTCRMTGVRLNFVIGHRYIGIALNRDAKFANLEDEHWINIRSM